jgi:hypothetical protein
MVFSDKNSSRDASNVLRKTAQENSNMVYKIDIGKH